MRPVGLVLAPQGLGCRHSILRQALGRVQCIDKHRGKILCYEGIGMVQCYR